MHVVALPWEATEALHSIGASAWLLASHVVVLQSFFAVRRLSMIASSSGSPIAAQGTSVAHFNWAKEVSSPRLVLCLLPSHRCTSHPTSCNAAVSACSHPSSCGCAWPRLTPHVALCVVRVRSTFHASQDYVRHVQQAHRHVLRHTRTCFVTPQLVLRMLGRAFKAAAERLLPARTSSAWEERGVLTPTEFVAAGDLLVRACPTWTWESGDPARRKSYLPTQKQFLRTRNVPCVRRAVSDEDGMDVCQGEADGFVQLNVTHEAAVDADLPLEDGSRETKERAVERTDQDSEELPDLEDYDADGNLVEAVEEEVDEALADETHILRTRTYDVSITYDKYYETPRVWLVGYDEEQRPLTEAEVMEDVSETHAGLTVSMEQHPHLPTRAASFHPCKHAQVMKRLCRTTQGENDAPMQADQYLFLFLKFMAVVMPTIEYDYTVAAHAHAQ